MKKLSTGDDSTLENYRKLAVDIFGEDSDAVKMLDDKIKESPNGKYEEVLENERELVYVLMSLSPIKFIMIDDAENQKE